MLPVVQLTINNSFNASLGETPFFALYGYDSPTITMLPPKMDYSDSDLSSKLRRISQIRKYCRETLLQVREKYTQATNSNRNPKEIKVGQRVFAKLNKHLTLNELDLPNSGPFIVVGKKGKALTIQASENSGAFTIHPDNLVISRSYPESEPADNTLTVSEPVHNEPAHNKPASNEPAGKEQEADDLVGVASGRIPESRESDPEARSSGAATARYNLRPRQ